MTTRACVREQHIFTRLEGALVPDHGLVPQFVEGLPPR